MSLSEFFASLNQNGQLLAGLGAVFAALFAGIGSAVGVGLQKLQENVATAALCAVFAVFHKEKISFP